MFKFLLKRSNVVVNIPHLEVKSPQWYKQIHSWLKHIKFCTQKVMQTPVRRLKYVFKSREKICLKLMIFKLKLQLALDFPRDFSNNQLRTYKILSHFFTSESSRPLFYSSLPISNPREGWGINWSLITREYKDNLKFFFQDLFTQVLI